MIPGSVIRNGIGGLVLIALLVFQMFRVYTQTIQDASDQASLRILRTASTVAATMDIDGLQSVVTQSSVPKSDPKLRHFSSQFRTVGQHGGISGRVLTVHKGPKGYWTGLSSEQGDVFRKKYPSNDSFDALFRQGGSIALSQTLIAVAPLRLRGGQVGAVVVEEPIEPSLRGAQWRYAQDAILYIGLITLVAGVAFSWSRSRMQERTEFMQTHDTVTGIPNRSMLVRHLGDAMEAAAKSESTVALICLGLDHFRHLNAELGPRAGDEALKALSRRLQGEAGNQSLVGRVAGDVFAVVQSGIRTTEDAQAFARRLMTTFDEPLRLGEQAVSVRATVGVALFPVHASHPASLLEAAEEALALAKNRARGQVWVFDDEASVNVKQRKTLARHLEHAAQRGELFMVYQPKVNRDTALVGAEALMRWRSPELGSVGPGQFIPVAEATGIIVPITYWAVETVCQQLKIWNDGQLKVAVNLSLHMFRDPHMVERLCDIVSRSGVPSNRLELEITESGLMRNPEVTMKALHQLKQFGFRLSIDDFGTGYSSLARLSQMPIDALKVDQSFVRGLDKIFSNAIMVRTIIQLGHSLDLEVIAEGVEEERHFAYLRELGCDMLQGYLFSKPLDAEVFQMKWLEVEERDNVIRLL